MLFVVSLIEKFSETLFAYQNKIKTTRFSPMFTKGCNQRLKLKTILNLITNTNCLSWQKF